MTKTAQFKLGDYVERVRNLHDNYLSVPIGTRFTINKVCDYYAWGDNMFIGIRDIELVSERDILAEAVAKAEAKRAKARKKYLAAGEAVAVAKESLAEYDEANRKPTFSERVAGFGIGAVLRGTSSTYIKLADNEWVSDAISTNRRFPDADFVNECRWTVLSEGVSE